VIGSLTLRNKAARALWFFAWLFLYRLSPRPCHRWRVWLLRCFGAKVGDETHPYPGSRIWAPWNLEAGIGVGIADGAEIYNPAPVILGDFATISQDAYLCSAGHDYTHPEFPLVTSPIEIGSEAWIAARAIVLMGVTIGRGCVVGAGSVVSKNTPDWTVCAGNPCEVIRSYEKRRD
jgi:putative colanic acid biosynthesis acetyltransferase WcaF